MVLRPAKSVMPDFFIIMTSKHCFHLFGAKPIAKGILVILQSSEAICGSSAPAFIVEKDRAEGCSPLLSSKI
jgi:hypothetical protein